MTNLPKVILYTDGSHRRKLNSGGYAGLLTTNNDFQLVFGNEEGAHNGRMELYAVVNSLRYLTQPCQVEIVSDAMYVVQGINQWIYKWVHSGWIAASTRKPVAHVDLWQELWEMMQVHKIHATWVKGHNGHPENEIVDYVANWSSGQSW